MLNTIPQTKILKIDVMQVKYDEAFSIFAYTYIYIYVMCMLLSLFCMRSYWMPFMPGAAVVLPGAFSRI